MNDSQVEMIEIIIGLVGKEDNASKLEMECRIYGNYVLWDGDFENCLRQYLETHDSPKGRQLLIQVESWEGYFED